MLNLEDLLPNYISLLKAVIKQADKDIKGIGKVTRKDKISAVDFYADGTRDDFRDYIRLYESSLDRKEEKANVRDYI